MSGPSEIVTYEKLMGAVGSLVWLWSGIERELADALRALAERDGENQVHGISKSIEVWSRLVVLEASDEDLPVFLCKRLVCLMKEALRVRNLVCHGLAGFYAQIRAGDEEAYLTVELGGERRNLYWSELQEMFSWMSRINQPIRELTQFAIAKRNGRMTEVLYQMKLLDHMKTFPEVF